MRQEGYKRATGEFCFGRDQLCNEIKTKTFEKGCVLLFGGRQAGKTTIMLKIAGDMSCERADVAVLSSFDLPVYVDLTSLPVEASPQDFFCHLADKANTACEQYIKGFEHKKLPSNSMENPTKDHLGVFVKDLLSILATAGEIDLRFLFLLDEAKRVLGGRFPRGFQDNLFSLLYGEHDNISERIAIVFSGAQDLLDFCEDETSPIGSRAGQCFVPCLELSAVNEIVDAVSREIDSHISGEEIARAIYRETGGHAGLSVSLARMHFAQLNANPDFISELGDSLLDENTMLFRIWTESLSREARAIHSILLKAKQFSRQKISAILREQNMDPFRSTIVMKEFVFTGIAREEDNVIKLTNNIYWNFVRSVGGYPIHNVKKQSPVTQTHSLQHKCWRSIEELEIKLREYVLKAYHAKWGDSSESMMKKALGDSSWRTIKSNCRKAKVQYPLCNEKRAIREIDSMYTGQLIQLIIWNNAWPLFQPFMPDKRNIIRWQNEVIPVRNDQAHFRDVPEKELNRCMLACDDFIVVLDKVTENL